MTLTRVSTKSLCPKCGKPDWCSISADRSFVICMRRAEGAIKETQNGGHLHRLRDSNTSFIRTISLKLKKPKREDFTELAIYFKEQGRKKPHRLQWLSEQLGIPVWTLNELHIGWSERQKAFSFPMQDSNGHIIGIRLRSWNGRKYAVTGSREGLFIPKDLKISSRILICEGPTDCAALLSICFPAIGRPSCTSGVKLIVEWIERNNVEDVIIVSDADEPGQRGAQKLTSDLSIYVPSIRIIRPPGAFKDIRDWVNAGATAKDIESSISRTPRHHLQVRGKTQ